MEKLTREKLKSMKPCVDGYDYWLDNCEGLETKAQLIRLFKYRFDWGIWLSTRLMNRIQRLELAIYSAELVLPVFENRYPNDNRPRLAVESADAVLKNNDMESREKAFRAANAADHAADYAADYADHAADYAADYADYAAAYAADYAAYVAYAAYAADAADAAYVAYAAGVDESAKQKIINKVIELFEEK